MTGGRSPAQQRAPSYQWYPRDFDMDEEVRLMSYEEEGVFRRLLDHQWFHDGLPADLDKLARLVPKIAPARFRKIWPAMAMKFEQVDGRLVNPKLERVRQDAARYIERQRNAGLMSAEARRQRRGSAQPASKQNAASNQTPNDTSNQTPNDVRTTVRTSVRTGIATTPEVATATATAEDETENVSSSQNGRTGAAPRPSAIFGTAVGLPVLTKLAHEVIDRIGETAQIADLADGLKYRCRQLRLTVSSPDDVTKALESALRQRTRRRA